MQGSRAVSVYRPLLLLSLAAASLVAGAPQQPQGDRAPSASPQRALINQYCVGCHNEKLKTAGLTLDPMSVEHVDQNPAVWEKVLRKVHARYMPPTGVPRPDEKSYDSLIAYLETSLDQLSAAKPNPGRTATLRRLTRTEYQNSIRDLLELKVDVTQLLPSDDSSFGFDNITVGELSPTLLERYLVAARKISRLAVGGAVRSPSGETILVPSDLTQEEHIDELPFGTRGGTAAPYTFPQDAEYEISLQLTRDRNEHVEGLAEPTDIELMLDGQRVHVFTVKPNNVIVGIRNANSVPSDELLDRDLHIRLAVKAGPHTLGVAFPKKPTLLQETERQPYQAHFNMYRHPRLNPALYSILVVGPYEASGAGDTPSRRRIFTCRPGKPSEEDGCAEQILSNLARLPPSRDDCRSANPAQVLSRYPRGRGIRSRDREGPASPAGQSGVPVPGGAGSGQHRAAYSLPAHGCGAGYPAVFLPVEQHTRR
jgi:mono/diheme cytochrome c family protein